MTTALGQMEFGILLRRGQQCPGPEMGAERRVVMPKGHPSPGTAAGAAPPVPAPPAPSVGSPVLCGGTGRQWMASDCQ